MRIIPVINTTDFETVKKRILIADRFLKDEERHLHLDISDGKYTPVYSLIDEKVLKLFIQKHNLDLRFSVHIMVKNPESHLEQWISFGAKKIIFPLETLFDPFRVAITCKSRGVTPVLSISPMTSVDELIEKGKGYNNFQILAVSPGHTGQDFKDGALSKIVALRKKMPQSIIEVDGGVNDKTIIKIKEAGADIVDVGNYIFSDINPADKYDHLKQIIK